MTAIRINLRMFFVCLAAAAAAFPMAIVSLAKLLLFLFALTALATGWRRKAAQAWQSMWTPKAILLSMLLLAASLVWTTAALPDALNAFGKHGKLIIIPILLSLIRSRREALLALACFGAGQLFLLTSTWLLVAGVQLPWAISRENLSAGTHAVFSSYLDQSIMTGVAASICWHLRDHIPGRHSLAMASGVVIFALACVFFVFPGRTGYAVAIALVCLGIMWHLPRRYRLGAILAPMALLLVLLASSSQLRERLTAVGSEVLAFKQKGDDTSSSGARLNFWERSLQAMSERPWAGYGVGSWDKQYNRLQQKYVPTHQAITGNPHQEYLLWGVELGLTGILLFFGMLLAVYRDSLKMDPPISRATQSVLLALTISCLFNSSLYDALIGDFFSVVLGILLALGIRTASPANCHDPQPKVTT